jgi:hypothetical protein
MKPDRAKNDPVVEAAAEAVTVVDAVAAAVVAAAATAVAVVVAAAAAIGATVVAVDVTATDIRPGRTLSNDCPPRTTRPGRLLLMVPLTNHPSGVDPSSVWPVRSVRT